MALIIKMLRTCGLICYLLSTVTGNNEIASEPWINSFFIDSKQCSENNCKYSLNVRGGEFLGHLSWRLTTTEGARGGSCDVIYPNYDLREVKTGHWETAIEVVLPFEKGKVFFCLNHAEVKNSPFGGKWVHQGSELFLEPAHDVVSTSRHSKIKPQKEFADLQQQTNTWSDLTHDTDVNNKISARLPRHEQIDIEILHKNKYVPLNEITDSLYSNEIRVRRSDEDKGKTLGSNYVRNPRSNNDKYDKADKLGFDVKSYYKSDKTDIDMNSDAFRDPRSDNDKYHKTNMLSFDDISDVKGDKTAINLGFDNVKDPRSDKEKQITPTYDNNDNKPNDNKQRHVRESDSDVRRKREIMRMKNWTDILDGPGISKRQTEVTHPGFVDSFTSVRADGSDNMVKIDGIRVEESSKEPFNENGVPSVLAGTAVTLRLFGAGLTTRTVIVLTYDKLLYGQPCKFFLKGEYMAKRDSVTDKSALFDIIAPIPTNESKLYVCAKNLKPGVENAYLDEDKYYHQGTETFKTLATHQKLLPLWATLGLITICLCFSALFSGLNLGLMSLDRTELKIISNTGTEQERKYARAIMPVRDHGNYLLCSILLGNVAVNSTFTILLDDLTSGLFAVVFSTLAIVLLGEITPQAICSRHGLMVGARSIAVTKAVMGITAPLAYPISKLLDYFLGEEIGNVYNRERLKELVKVTNDVNDLDRDEVNIISGALELRKKTVLGVMTKLEDVFMLPLSSILDFETMSEIVKSGYSRIPVFEESRTNIVTVLFIKDLAFVDPDDNTPLRTLAQYYQNPCNFVFEDVTLDVMFRQFKEGHKGHMAFVHRINNEGEGDPFYETIGLVTLEDVIEEMIQAEIVDETDVFLDNRSKRRRNKPQHKLQDFAAFAEKHENQRIHISPQLTLATFQFLSTSVDVFKPDVVSETVLRRLLRRDVVRHIKVKGRERCASHLVFQQGKPDVLRPDEVSNIRDVRWHIKVKGRERCPSHLVFQQGKLVDYFVLLLEGRAEVTVGRENLVFEAGPFTYFGVQALTQNVGVAESPTPSIQGSLQNINMDAMLRHTFVPDYSVRAVTELYYLAIKRSLYLAAKRATLMEKGALPKGASNDLFDNEVDKLLQSVDEDLSVSGDHKTPSRQVSPNPPASASPLTRARFTSPASPDHRSDADEQEKLLK